MIRKLQLTLAPSAALQALVALAAPAAAPGLLPGSVGRALARTFRALHRRLQPLAAALDLLVARRLARLPGASRSRVPPRPAWQQAVRIDADLQVLAHDQGAPAVLQALRTVLEAASGPVPFAVQSLRVGARRVGVRRALALLRTGPRARPRAARARGPDHAPPPAPAFGGLPDDAASRPRAQCPPAGPRGLTADAEAFLATAGIATWPCPPARLQRARKRVLAALHPDRAGEAATPAFHRAIRGHAELVARLREARAAARPAAARPARASAAPGPVATATGGEWPPPAPPPPPARAVLLVPATPVAARARAAATRRAG